MTTAALIISDSHGSLLLKEKLMPSKSPSGVEKKEEYYRKNKNLNEWIKWKMPLIFKLNLAFEVNFKSFIYWNIRTVNLFPARFMYSACLSKAKDLVELLILRDNGANCFKEALCSACVSGHKEIVELILDKIISGCKIGNVDWNQVLDSAQMSGDFEIIDLIKYYKDQSILQFEEAVLYI